LSAPEPAKVHYIIRGGVAGRDRLKVLARIMRPAALELFQRAGLQPGMACLDVGCGSGDISFDLAQMTGAGGKAVGMDMDAIKVDLARGEASERKVSNVEFRACNICETNPEPEYDFVHARFLLTHLKDPLQAVRKFRDALKPGGIIALSDIDSRGYFSYPDCPALQRYAELYTLAASRRGCDPNIGPRLPSLLTEAGFENVQMHVVQPASTASELKMIVPMTMDSIGDAVVAEGLAAQSEVDRLVAELTDFANTPGTVFSMPRVVEAWGHRPQA
jgi:2-polyprenyl-3-methyl-5-hydroxy-6-metoxy-1,4-benzoquinol methylase